MGLVSFEELFSRSASAAERILRESRRISSRTSITTPRSMLLNFIDFMQEQFEAAPKSLLILYQTMEATEEGSGAAIQTAIDAAYPNAPSNVITSLVAAQVAGGAARDWIAVNQQGAERSYDSDAGVMVSVDVAAADLAGLFTLLATLETTLEPLAGE